MEEINVEEYAKQYVLKLLELDKIEIESINLGYNLSQNNKIRLKLNKEAYNYIKENWRVT